MIKLLNTQNSLRVDTERTGLRQRLESIVFSQSFSLYHHRVPTNVVFHSLVA